MLWYPVEDIFYFKCLTNFLIEIRILFKLAGEGNV